jgi:hypothetical protein
MASARALGKVHRHRAGKMRRSSMAQHPQSTSSLRILIVGNSAAVLDTAPRHRNREDDHLRLAEFRSPARSPVCAGGCYSHLCRLRTQDDGRHRAVIGVGAKSLISMPPIKPGGNCPWAIVPFWCHSRHGATGSAIVSGLRSFRPPGRAGRRRKFGPSAEHRTLESAGSSHATPNLNVVVG